MPSSDNSRTRNLIYIERLYHLIHTFSFIEVLFLLLSQKNMMIFHTSKDLQPIQFKVIKN